MALLKHLNNEKSAHAETPAMQYPTSQPDPTSPPPGLLNRSIIRPALLLILLFFSSFSALAYDCEVAGIYYNLNTTDKTASVAKGSYNGDVVIPETITYDNTTYSVTSIGDSAFAYCSKLTSVTIPNSVTSIGSYAFEGCYRLTSVVIPNSVTTIDYKAFANCSGLTSVTIPNSVTAIGGWAFINCTRLSSVSFNAEKCIKMGYRKDVQSEVYFVFAGCTSLTTLTIGDKVTTIPSYAFRGCSGLTSVTIPNSVTTIDYEAFRDCSRLASLTFNAEKCGEMGSTFWMIFKGCTNLTSLTIGDKISTIPVLPFSDFTSLVVDKNNGKYDSRENCNAIIETSTNELIKGCNSTIIPNSVTSIGSAAFYNCSGLTSVTIPNSVTTIGDEAFYGCSGLTSVTIPNSITSIGGYAFYGCTKLASVSFNAEKCIEMGNYNNVYIYPAFNNCASLTTLTIGDKVTTIPSNAFRSCFGLTSVTISNSVASIGSKAFCGCSGLTSVTIGNSVTSIGDYAFSDCSGLTSVTFNAENCPKIDNSVFENCASLSSLIIGDKVGHQQKPV